MLSGEEELEVGRTSYVQVRAPAHNSYKTADRHGEIIDSWNLKSPRCHVPSGKSLDPHEKKRQ